MRVWIDTTGGLLLVTSNYRKPVGHFIARISLSLSLSVSQVSLADSQINESKFSTL